MLIIKIKEITLWDSKEMEKKGNYEKCKFLIFNFTLIRAKNVIFLAWKLINIYLDKQNFPFRYQIIKNIKKTINNLLEVKWKWKQNRFNS